jgi:hypothetical protein
MDMSLYTSMSSTQMHVYYFIFYNELLVNSLIINM